MIRITIDGEVEQLNSKLTIEPQLWDVAASKAKGRSAKILELNSRLNDIQVIMKDHYYDIQRRHGYVTAEMVKNAYMGITAREESLLKLYEQHLEDTKKTCGIKQGGSHLSEIRAYVPPCGGVHEDEIQHHGYSAP